ncbi:hypothetical protein D088_970217 [Salmonella enterica subsp. houtenae serovar 16:z4,z32:-- str. RKS3027]|nr:hypothetical protein D088_970217 [Salmonella enterica subsp. houtenae serovar 16:z4,z32:-- str. RKS3027]
MYSARKSVTDLSSNCIRSRWRQLQRITIADRPEIRGQMNRLEITGGINVPATWRMTGIDIP